MHAGPGDILVEPNPVPEGGEIRITIKGPGPVRVSVDLGEWQEIAVDPKTGSAKFEVPPGARVLVVADQEDGRVQVEVRSAG